MKDSEQTQSAILDDNDSLNKHIEPTIAPSNHFAEDDSIVDLIAKFGEIDQVDINKLNQFTHVSRSRNQIYDVIDQMCEDPIIAAVLETYAEDATEYAENGKIVWVQSDDDKINKYIEWLLQVLEIDKNAYRDVYALCKYGDIYWERFTQEECATDKFFGNLNKEKLNEDVKVVAYSNRDKFANYIELVSNPARIFELERFGKIAGYVEADINNNINLNKSSITGSLAVNNFLEQYRFNQNDVYLYPNNKFVHATLDDNSTRTQEKLTLYKDNKDINDNKGIDYKVRRGQSILYTVFKIWRELSLLENSMLLNRVTKSAVTRVVNIEVGDQPKESVSSLLQGVKSLMEQKSALSAGNSMQEYTNPGPMENTIYVPTRDGKGQITTTQVGGDVNVGQLPDIDYFQNKFFGAMRVPKQYFGLTEDGAGFNGGQSLAIISSRYAKMIKRIQHAYLQGLTTLINLNLIERGLDKYVGKFTLQMQPPTTQEEIDRRDNVAARVQIVRDTMDLMADIDDPVIKTKMLKALVSTVVTDSTILSLLEDQIEKLEKETTENDSQEQSQSEEESISHPSSFPQTSGGVGDPLNLDQELDLDVPESSSDTTTNSQLPTPEELNNDIDFTDNDIEIQN